MAIIYSNNANSQILGAGANVNFGNTVRHCGNTVYLSGGNVVVADKGYYNVFVTLVFEADAGEASFQVYDDGVAVTGASAMITTLADTSYSVVIPCVIRETCCCEKTITVQISSGTVTISNASIVVEKV